MSEQFFRTNAHLWNVRGSEETFSPWTFEGHFVCTVHTPLQFYLVSRREKMRDAEVGGSSSPHQNRSTLRVDGVGERLQCWNNFRQQTSLKLIRCTTIDFSDSFSSQSCMTVLPRKRQQKTEKRQPQSNPSLPPSSKE